MEWGLYEFGNTDGLTHPPLMNQNISNGHITYTLIERWESEEKFNAQVDNSKGVGHFQRVQWWAC
jgi:hypothetical protein